ncbi:MAG TPA: aldehyde dehydrogenase family protein, partial [Candidatus Eisenbacteria bacterium]|nr:aldehyde dehydrogenase family protein [Candidatus Eisenbacteria bacterium]
MLRSVNPATNETVETYKKTTPAETERMVDRADRAFESWRRATFGVRATSMRKAAALLEERKERAAALMAVEMGKPLAQGRSEIEKCAWACRFFADHAEEFLAPEPAETDASRSYVAYRPLGVILGVMPWNFPFWQVFRFAAPALMAGNACVLKHASNVPGCALAIGEVFRDAGFPEGLFGVLLVGSDKVVRVLELPRVRAVALTGSSAAGRSIASHAGRLIKKSVLELGGSDPYVVLEDADLDFAVETSAAARLVNAGQSCIAAKRFIVLEPVRDEFTKRFVERLRRTR